MITLLNCQIAILLNCSTERSLSHMSDLESAIDDKALFNSLREQFINLTI